MRNVAPEVRLASIGRMKIGVYLIRSDRNANAQTIGLCGIRLGTGRTSFQASEQVGALKWHRARRCSQDRP